MTPRDVNIRERPLTDTDAERGSAWRTDGSTIQPEGKDAADAAYYLDSVLSSSCNTEAVYQQAAKDIVTRVVAGFCNGTVLTYTTSGKPLTMGGTACSPGIFPVATKDILDQVASTQDRKYLLRAHDMEVRF